MGIPISSNQKTDPIFYASQPKHIDPLKRIRSLFLNAIPLSKGSIDDRGNDCHLWALSKGGFLGTVCHPSVQVSMWGVYSTVTDLARLRGWSILVPLDLAMK